MKALIKKKKEKDNVIRDLELINLKNVCMLQPKELRRKIVKVEREKLIEDKKEYQITLHHL
jgi:hypothetical protein